MKLSSTVFSAETRIPTIYTCDGEDRIPPLEITGVPEGTISLTIIMDDPDVPASVRPEQMWDHWLCWNIPPQTSAITEGAEPQGVVGHNSGGKKGYMGPCPPDREHRYFFKLYAIDTMLDIPETATKDELLAAMGGHILEQTELMGRYNRPENEKKKL